MGLKVIHSKVPSSEFTKEECGNSICPAFSKALCSGNHYASNRSCYSNFQPPSPFPQIHICMYNNYSQNGLNLDFLVHDIYTDDKHKLFEYIFTQIKHVLISL